MVKYRHRVEFKKDNSGSENPISYFQLSVAGIATVEEYDTDEWLVKYGFRIDTNDRSGFYASNIDIYVVPRPETDMAERTLTSFSTSPPDWTPESFEMLTGSSVVDVLTLSGGGPWTLSVPKLYTASPTVDELTNLYEVTADGDWGQYSLWWSVLDYDEGSFYAKRLGSNITGALKCSYSRGGDAYYTSYALERIYKSHYTWEQALAIELDYYAIYSSSTYGGGMIGSGTLQMQEF